MVKLDMSDWFRLYVAVQRSKTAADHSDESLFVMAYILQLILPTLNYKLWYMFFNFDPNTYNDV